MLKLIVEKGYGDSMQTRNVPTKNYVIFTAMAIFVIAAVLYSANWYSITKDYFIDYYTFFLHNVCLVIAVCGD